MYTLRVLTLELSIVLVSELGVLLFSFPTVEPVGGLSSDTGCPASLGFDCASTLLFL